eukprot:scaffold99448_cov45-Prasinocladus_malaysianus.AAC.1
MLSAIGVGIVFNFNQMQHRVQAYIDSLHPSLHGMCVCTNAIQLPVCDAKQNWLGMYVFNTAI